MIGVNARDYTASLGTNQAGLAFLLGLFYDLWDMEPQIAPFVVLFAVAQAVGLGSLVFRATILRKVVASVSLLASGLILGVTVGNFLRLWIVPFAVIGAYQLFNIARIIENRMHVSYLRRQVLFSGSILLALSIASAFAELLEEWLNEHSDDVKLAYAIFVLIVAARIFVTTVQTVRKTRLQGLKKFHSDSELPTVSVLVAARNEDAALTECIHVLLQSDYPKLEIIVLDDCSQDKSSDIIKSFAGKGVRFIQGDQPRENWLAKNQAYETLAAAASGEWLIFTSVDVQFGPSAIRNLMNQTLNKNIKMLSILPVRAKQSILVSFLSPLRYFWEMSAPRRLHPHQRPAVLSTVWMIEKKALHDSGGFAAVSRAVSPEGYFAKRAKAYRFVRSSTDVSVLTSRSLRNQYETAVRTYYPELRRRIHRAMGMTVLGLGSLVMPFVLWIVFLISQDPLPAIILIPACLLLTASHATVVAAVNPAGWLVALLNFPIVALQEMVLLNVSMYRYEFSEVYWKGRNICYPVMRVVPRLPGLDDPKPTKRAVRI